MNTLPLTLATGQHWSAGRARSLALRCHTGTLWVTLRGEAGDHILQAGDSLRLTGVRDILIGALAPTTLDITSEHLATETGHGYSAIPG